jgi:hypothetical protein
MLDTMLRVLNRFLIPVLGPTSLSLTHLGSFVAGWLDDPPRR